MMLKEIALEELEKETYGAESAADETMSMIAWYVQDHEVCNAKFKHDSL